MGDITLHMNDKAICKDISSLPTSQTNILRDRLKAGPSRTRVLIKNHDTGEVLVDKENKVVITGSQLNACAMFGLEPLVKFPTYNTAMKLDNSNNASQVPKNNPIVCLFCVSDSGCGATPKDVYVAKFTDRIKPAPAEPTDPAEFDSTMIMPFRYVDAGADINMDLRKHYFGRKTFTRLGKIGYYFKRFDTDPQLHLRYADGTEIGPDMYDVQSTQEAECYVDMRLRITRLDFRDYFENVLGWDKGRISSLSLCTAWYDDDIDDYRWYQDITPYTLLNFSLQWLVDDTIALDIEYQIYY
jgi:hypothetical protein